MRRIPRVAALSLAVVIAGTTCTPAFAAPPQAEQKTTQENPHKSPPPKTPQGEATVREATDRFVVTMEEEDTTVPEAEDALDDQDVEVVKETGTEQIVVEAPEELDKSEQKDLIEELESDPEVVSVEPDLIVENATSAQTSNDPLYASTQWSLPNMNVASAWGQSSADGVVIGIGDTGSTPHPDLVSDTLPGYDFVHPDFSRDGNYRDADPNDPGTWSGGTSSWHGTHVAGIAAADTNNGIGIAGVAQDAKLQHARLLGTGTNGYVSDIADGLLWSGGGSIPGVPDNKTPASVVNLSMNWPAATCPTSMKSSIDKLHAMNVPVVVASGNNAVDAGGTTPSNCLGAIVVGSSNIYNSLSSYSNWGWPLDVVAPGGDANRSIYSTFNASATTQGAASYGWTYGTSMAAPHVSGVIAMMKEKNPGMTVEQIRNTLVSSSTQNVAGYKKVNAGAAVAATPNRRGAIGNYYLKNGGSALMGVSTGPQKSIGNGAVMRTYYRPDNGRTYYVYNHSSVGTFHVDGGSAVGKHFVANGGASKYGYPKHKLAFTSDSSYQTFRHPVTKKETVLTYRNGKVTASTPTQKPTASNGSATMIFKDVSTKTAHAEHIKWMKDQKITTGWKDGTFRPHQAVDRNAMIAFLYRMEGSPKVKLPAKSPFKDVKPTDPFYKEIVWAYQNGISTGWGDGTFRPNESIRRDAMAAFLYRLDGKPAVKLPAKASFKDVSKSRQFYKEIEWMKKEGITTGWSDGTFRPNDNTNRDAMAAFLHRFAS